MSELVGRRSFLTGLVAAIAAPAVIRTPRLLMPVKSIIEPTVSVDTWKIVDPWHQHPVRELIQAWHTYRIEYATPPDNIWRLVGVAP